MIAILNSNPGSSVQLEIERNERINRKTFHRLKTFKPFIDRSTAANVFVQPLRALSRVYTRNAVMIYEYVAFV